MPRLHRLTCCAIALVLAPAIPAQQPDSIARLPDLGVTASRTALPPGAAGLSISQLPGDVARRGRTNPSLDELLALVPGVLARDRSDPSLDTRIAIRGAGARANFGVRGVRVLLDGVPATLPDGQTPLTQLDLDLVERIEVARGPLAALHGNGSLGVVSLRSPARWGPGWRTRASAEGGVEPGFQRQGVAIGGGGTRIGGLLAGSRMRDDGWREHARAEQWRLRASGEWQVRDATALTLRGSWAHDPTLQSPGALTLAEFADAPRSAAPNSLTRDAGKQLDQRQLAIGVRHHAGTIRLDANAWSIWRDLDNPLAAPAPAPTTAQEGTWVGIDRRVIGARTTIEAPLGSRAVWSAGLDLQRMVDDRVNRRHLAGTVSGQPFLDQEERVGERGLFAQVVTFAGRGISLRAGARHDRVAFLVNDRLDPAAGGERVLASWSGSGAFAWQGEALALWMGAGTAFETPTTTELANRPDGSTGLNRDLDPARTVGIESGARFQHEGAFVEMVAFTTRTTDAITPIAESGGRSYFANVGATGTRGVELAAAWRPSTALAVHGTLTALRARFGERATNAAGDLITGHALPGVAPLTARLGATVTRGAVLIDVDHAWARATWADDANTIRVPGWKAGVTNALLRYGTRWHGSPLTVRFAVRNLFDRSHASGVVVNGGFGRVVEPGPGRRLLVGVELGS